MLKKKKILIVEDERLVAEDTKNRLQVMGYEVTGIAATSDGALKKIESNPVDLVIMDIKLKGPVNGIETARLVRTRFDIPVIYLTAYADEETLERVKKSQPFGFITKPFDDREMQAVIETAIYKHKLEKQIRKSEAWLFTTLMSIGDGVITTDISGKITFMNPIAEKMTGWTTDEAKGKYLKEVFKIINEDSRESVENPVDRVLRDGVVVGLANHTLLINRDGKEISIADSGAPITDEEGEIVGVVLVFRDVTKEREAERAVREARAYAESIVDTVRDPLIVLDDKFTVLSANRSFYRTFSAKPKEIIGNNFFKLGGGQWDIPELRRLLKEILPKNTSFEDFEVDHEFKRIGRKTMLLNARRIYREANKTQMILIAIEDITERKRAEEKAAHLTEVLLSIRNINQLITRENDRKRLLGSACKILVDVNRYISAFITTEDEVFKAGDIYLWESIQEIIKKRGLSSIRRLRIIPFGESYLALIPFVKYNNRLMLYVVHSKQFSEEELGLLDEIGSDLAFALYKIRLENERRLVEEKVKEDKVFLDTIFEAIQDGISVLNTDMTIRMVNGVMKNWYRENLPLEGRKCYSAYHNRKRPCDPCPTLRCIKSGRVEHDIVPGLKGSVAEWIDLYSYPIKDPATGRVTGVVEFVRDITERKRKEEELKENEEKFRTFAEQSPNMIFINKNGKVVYVNNKCEELLGYRSDEFLSPRFDFFKLVAPESVDMMKKNYAEHLKGRDVKPHEYTLITKDGRRVESIVATKLIKYEGEDAILGIVTDITRQKETEEKYRNLIDNTKDLIFTVDFRGKILFANRSAKHFTGIEAEETIGHDFSEYVHPDDVEKLRRNMERIIRGESPEKVDGILNEVEFRMVRKDGEVIWVACKSTPIRDSKGRVVEFSGISRDITEKKRIEEELKYSEEQIRSILNASEEIIFTKNREGVYILANTAFSRIFRKPIDQIVGKKDEDLFSKEEAARIRAIDLEVFESGKVHRSEDILDVCGERRIFVATKVPIRDADGNVIELCGFARDVTEKRKAEKALRESEEKYRNLVEHSPDGIFIMDLKGRLLSVNRSIIESLGYTEKELLRMSGWDIITEKYKKQFRERIGSLSKGKILNTPIEYEVVTKSGKEVTIEIRSTPILKDGKVVAFQAVARDITERKRAERALYESEEKFRSVVENSHDGIAIVDDNFRFIYANDMMCKILGYSRREVMKSNIMRFLDDESRNIVIDRYTSRISGKKVPSKYEFNIIRKDGKKRRVEVKSALVSDSEGRRRIITQIHDITEQRKAEKTRSAIYRISEAAIASKDLNELFLSIHAIVAELMVADNFYIALYDSATDRIQFPYFVDAYDKKPSSRMAAGGLTGYVIRTGRPLLADQKKLEELIKGGEVKPRETKCLYWLGVPLKTRDETIGVLTVQSYSEGVRYGQEEKMMLMFVSSQIAMAIERIRADQQLQKELKEKELLLKEVHHRVKNNLQVICSLLNLQAMHVKDTKSLEMFRESRDRVRSMALIHETLYRSKSFAGVDFATYIENVAHGLFSAYNIDPHRVELRVDVEGVSLGIDMAVPCGLVINELLSNSLKHAFPASFKGRGRILIELRSKNGKIELIVRDNGIGIPEEIDIHRTESLGLHIVNILVKDQLGGEIRVYRRGGTKFRITFQESQ